MANKLIIRMLQLLYIENDREPTRLGAVKFLFL